MVSLKIAYIYIVECVYISLSKSTQSAATYMPYMNKTLRNHFNPSELCEIFACGVGLFTDQASAYNFQNSAIALIGAIYTYLKANF